MPEELNRRFVELSDAFKRLAPATPGLEVGAGRFVLIPPGEVRLTGFRARLMTSDGGAFATLLVDSQMASLEAHPGGMASDSLFVTERLTIDLRSGYGLDGEVMKHASVMARALLD